MVRREKDHAGVPGNLVYETPLLCCGGKKKGKGEGKTLTTAASAGAHPHTRQK